MTVKPLEREIFGHTDAGEPVYRVTIRGGGLTANVITWGSVIQDLRLEGHQPPLVLGFEDFDSYPKYSSNFGATPGRCANRIAGGKFTLDGKAYQLDLNEKGVNHLHGGASNIGKQNWVIADLKEDSVRLEIVDPDGRCGYAGNCSISATYAVHGDGVLTVVYEATTDQPTLANLCQHSYFNLDGKADILDHDMLIAADYYLPTDANLIPTGELRPVGGTPFDFRQMRPIRMLEDGKQVGYDHNFCLSTERGAKRAVALAKSSSSGVSMEVRTTEPGVQFYAAVKLATPVPGLEGRTYGAFSGFCMETQVWPDAINHESFPSPVLRPGEVLRQETDYVFTKG